MGSSGIMPCGSWNRADGTVRSMGLIAGLRAGLGGAAVVSSSHPKRFAGSSSVTRSADSQADQASVVVGKPNEVAERAGDSGDRGDAAESEVRSSVPRSSVSKMDTGEKSE